MNPLTFLLLINSILLIGLILNQNESTKESTTNQISNSSPNPLQNITWICLSFEFIFLLIKTKITDF
jgi:preprotein translocase subunit SecG